MQGKITAMSDRELRSYKRMLRLRRERRRRCMTALGIVLATLCVVCFCSMSYGALKSKASSGFKYYTSVTVAAGETLWELADSYVDYDYYKNKSSYIAEVQQINHLDEQGSITAGQVLILPYYSAEYIY